MIFSLIQDFADALGALPAEHPRRRNLALLDEAIRRDVHFIDRHPTTLFQCLWNTCSWYDSLDAVRYYSAGQPPSTSTDEPLHKLMSRWLEKKRAQIKDWRWLRSMRPPRLHLGARLQFEFSSERESQVRNLAFSIDGKRLAAVTADNTLYVRGEVGELAAMALSGEYWPAKFLPDGSIALAGGTSGLQLGDLDARTVVESSIAKGHTCWNFHVAADNRNLAIQGGAGAVTVWDLAEQQVTATYPSHGTKATLHRLSSDGRHLAWLDSNYHLHVKELATGQARDVPVVGGNRADDLAISPGGRYVALAVNDPTPRGGPFSPRTPIRVYDGKSLEILWEHDPAGGRTWSIEFSPDGTQLAVARDNTVEFRHSATGKPSAETIYQEFEQIHSICYSADGRLLATGTELGAVHVWLIAGANPAKLYEPWSEITAVVVVQDGEVVVTGSTGEIYAWEASDGSPSRRIAVGEDHYGMAMPNEVNDLCVSPNGKSVAVGCRDGALACWDLTTGNQHFSHRAGLQVVPGGSTIGQQGILNFGGNQGYRSLPGHSDSVTGVDFSSDGSVLASASRDKTVRLWDMNAPDKEVGFYRLGDVFQLADVVPTCIRYSPDDQFLAIGCADGWIQQLDVSTGQVVRKIGPQQNSIRRMEFSSNGERLLSVVGDSLQIWRVSDGKCLQSIPQCLYASVEIQRCPEWPFQVVHGDRETTLQTAQGVPLAWIPDALDRFMLLPAGATATGSALSHFYMFALEGFWPGRVLMTQTTPAQAKGVLQQVQDLLDTRQPEKALELLTDNRQEDDDRWNNAYGVCYLRMGEFEESRKKFRGLVFSGPGMAFRSEAAVVFKTNFAATLLAEGRLEECLERLREINDEQAPCVQQLRQTIEGWKNRQSRLRRWFGLFGGRPHVATIRELALGELQ